LDLSPLQKLNIEIDADAKLSEYTTFQLGGACKSLFSCQSPHQLEETLKLFVKNKVPFLIIGGGSNLVVSDKGIDCNVIRYFAEAPLIERSTADLVVSGSTRLNDLALFATQDELEGLNFASGIPGTVGGAIVGNAGAFGKQISDCLKSAILISREGVRKEVLANELGFEYRHSILKETGDIVLSASFALTQGSREQLLQERGEIMALRKEKHPDYEKQPTAGSFFKNIDNPSKGDKKQAAGWFLDQAGAKSLKCGGAGVFSKHANMIIKEGSKCTAQDVHDLSKKMSASVKQKFGIDLKREVRFVGEFSAMDKNADNMIW